MPIYEYRCSQCAHELEALQRLADAPLVACPACGKEALRKLVSAAGFQLKGSGWYATDFRGSGSKPAADKADGETKSDAAKSDAAKSDAAKPDAAKPEATKSGAPAAKSDSTTTPAPTTSTTKAA